MYVIFTGIRKGVDAVKRIEPVIIHETLYIAAATAMLSVIMELVFLIGGWWNYTVLLGNLLGFFAAVLNFFLMGLTVQSAVEKDKDEAAKQIKLSMTLRNLMLVAVMALAAIFDVFNFIAAVIPLLFPSVAVKLRPLISKKDKEGGTDVAKE